MCTQKMPFRAVKIRRKVRQSKASKVWLSGSKDRSLPLSCSLSSAVLGADLAVHEGGDYIAGEGHVAGGVALPELVSGEPAGGRQLHAVGMGVLGLSLAEEAAKQAQKYPHFYEHQIL